MQRPLTGFHPDLHKIFSQGPLQDLGQDLQLRMHHEALARSSKTARKTNFMQEFAGKMPHTRKGTTVL